MSVVGFQLELANNSKVDLQVMRRLFVFGRRCKFYVINALNATSSVPLKN